MDCQTRVSYITTRQHKISATDGRGVPPDNTQRKKCPRINIETDGRDVPLNSEHRKQNTRELVTPKQHMRETIVESQSHRLKRLPKNFRGCITTRQRMNYDKMCFISLAADAWLLCFAPLLPPGFTVDGEVKASMREPTALWNLLFSEVLASPFIQPRLVAPTCNTTLLPKTLCMGIMYVM